METFLPEGLPEVLAGRYRLGDLLGQGGTAQVYAARDERSGAQVAVKLYWDGAAVDPARRHAEVATLARLHHPNLVELLDAGFDGGREFSVMALADGSTLADVLRTGPLGLARTGQLAAALAGALAYVHAQGVVHRDVKPGNVLFGPGERVRLSDFGIARAVADTRITSTGLMIGTAGYFAPEQVTGEHIGAAADIYALGLVLLECLTGRREYAGGGLESALARLHRRPWLPPDLPTGWHELLEAMTRTSPSERPMAGQVLAAVEALAEDPEAELPPLGEEYPLAAAAAGGATAAAGSRRRRWAAPVLAGALALLAGAAFAVHGLGGAAAPTSSTVVPPAPIAASTDAPRIQFASPTAGRGRQDRARVPLVPAGIPIPGPVQPAASAAGPSHLPTPAGSSPAGGSPGTASPSATASPGSAPSAAPTGSASATSSPSPAASPSADAGSTTSPSPTPSGSSSPLTGPSPSVSPSGPAASPPPS